CALATTAPELSVTVPVTVPRLVWASAATLMASTTSAIRKNGKALVGGTAKRRIFGLVSSLRLRDVADQVLAQNSTRTCVPNREKFYIVAGPSRQQFFTLS